MENKIPKYGTTAYRVYQYQRRLEEQRGHNYEWYNEQKFEKYLEKGYLIHTFVSKFDGESTSAEFLAQEAVLKYRSEGYYARIICGYDKNVQRMKQFTVIYKKRK